MSKSKRNNKIAMVTGGTSGIGLEIALVLLQSGFKVYIPGRTADASSVSDRFVPYLENESVRFIKADFADELGVETALDDVPDERDIDLLVHSAAYYSQGPIESTNVLELDRSYRVNVRAPYLITQRLLPKLKSAKGTVVFLNSSAVKSEGKPSLAAYTLSKSALLALAGSLRQEVNEKGVRVLSVFLGKTDTPMQEKVCKNAGLEYKPDRMIQPEHAAKLICDAALAPADMECTDLHIRPSVPYES